MLEYNGYSFKAENNRFVFRHSAIDRFGLTSIIVIIGLVTIALIVFQPLLGIAALVVAFLIFMPIIKRDKGRSRLEIDGENQILKVNLNDQKVKKSFSEIDSVYTCAKFVDEYSSAFKSTSKKYRVTIGLESGLEKIPLFKLIADHEKPSKEMNEVHNFLETILRNGK